MSEPSVAPIRVGVNPLFSKAAIVFNPAAGKADPVVLDQVVGEHFTRANRAYEILEISGRDDVEVVVSKAIARGCDLVVVAGGDGTLSSVAKSLVNSEVPLGILPVGTANVLARELGIPQDLAEACRLLVEDPVKTKIDVMEVGEHVSVSHVSVGIYSLIADKVTPEVKKSFGHSAYLWALLRETAKHKSWAFSIEVDGRSYYQRASLVLIANAGSVGVSTLRWGTEIRPDDGEVNVCIVRAQTLRDYLAIVWHLLLGRHQDDLSLKYLTAKRSVTVRASELLPVRVDGEIIDNENIDLQVLPKALWVLVPGRLESLSLV